MNRLGNLLVVILLLGILVGLIVINPFSGSETQVSYPTTTALSVGGVTSAAWNGESLRAPSVLYDEAEALYKMWYIGQGSGIASGVGYATSADGRAWNRSDFPDPILTPRDQWEAGGVTAVSVVKDGSSYHMWYSAADNFDEEPTERIGYATSADGITWAQAAGNPLMEPGLGNVWDNKAVSAPMVTNEKGVWRMWYTGKSDAQENGVRSEIGLATSTDGLRWIKEDTNPVLSPQAEWNEEGVLASDVAIFDNGALYEMWFAGTKNSKEYAIGRAYSVDGVTWVEDELNPIMWDENDSFTSPQIRFADGAYAVWLERAAKKGLTSIHWAAYVNPADGDQ